jgi:hypothetical protein
MKRKMRILRAFGYGYLLYVIFGIAFLRSQITGPVVLQFAFTNPSGVACSSTAQPVYYYVTNQTLYGCNGSTYAAITTGSGGPFLPLAGGTITGTTLIQPSSDSTNAVFNIKNSAGTTTFFQADSTNSRILFGDGAAASPGIGFVSEPGSGMYRAGTTKVAFDINGTPVATFTGSGWNIASGLSLEFYGSGITSADTNFSRTSGGVVAVGTGAAGSTAGSMSMTSITLSGSSFSFNGKTCTIVSTAISCS